MIMPEATEKYSRVAKGGKKAAFKCDRLIQELLKSLNTDLDPISLLSQFFKTFFPKRR